MPTKLFGGTVVTEFADDEYIAAGKPLVAGSKNMTWLTVKNRLNRIIDQDGDTWIDCDLGGVDIDKIVLQANQTGSNVALEGRDGNGDIIFSLLGDGKMNVPDFFKILTTGPGGSNIALELDGGHRKWVMKSYGSDGGRADIAEVVIVGKNISSDGKAEFNNISSLKYWGKSFLSTGAIDDTNIYGSAKMSYTDTYAGDLLINGGYHTYDYGVSESSHTELRGKVKIGEKSRAIEIYNVKSGATQAASTAVANEVWKTSGHATLPDNVLMIGG